MSERCRESSLAAGEPLIGSAPEVPLWIAFSWPKRSWHADKIARSEGLPPALARLEKDEAAAGRKIALRAFQREAANPGDDVELLCVAPCESRVLAENLPMHALAARVQDFLGGASGSAPRKPQLFVCTDGKHDRCCGLYGMSVLRALRKANTEAGAPFEIAEVSHLGGHRLAANALFLPSGRCYGRLAPGDAEALIAAERADKPLLANYRGRLGRSAPQQLAEAEVLGRFANAVALQFDGDGSEVHAAFEVDGTRQTLAVRCERRRFTSLRSCGPDETPETRERWIVTSTA